jgi:hypothetical protein
LNGNNIDITSDINADINNNVSNKLSAKFRQKRNGQDCLDRRQEHEGQFTGEISNHKGKVFKR